MADQDPSTPSPPSPTGPSGTAEERMAAIQGLEDGEAKKQSQMKWVDGANYGMLGADLGYGAYAAGTAATAAGATGAAAAGAAALAAVPAVVALGGAWVLGKIGVTGAIEHGAEWLGDKLGLTIGRGDPHPACVGDDIAHSSGFWGMVAGLAIGVAIGAMVAATVATGGLAGAVLVGACMAGGLSIGGALAAASQSMGTNCGKIASGSGNVTFEGKAAARVTDIIACDKHPGPEPLVEGSLTITVNQLPIVRIGHSSHCSGKVNSGRKSILIDKTTGQFGPKNPELTAGEEFLAGLLGGLVGAKLGGMIGGKAPGEPNKSAEREGVKEETATKCNDPIDVATGEMVEVRTDLSIPGVLPLTLARRYRTRSGDDDVLGPKWSVNWSRCLRLDEGRFVRFSDGGGLTITFDAPPDAELNSINLREPRYWLEGTRASPRILDDETRQVLVFAPLVDGAVSRLERIEDWNGNAISFDYDEHGRLAMLRHTVGYALQLSYRGAVRNVSSITLHERSGETRRLVDYVYHDGMLAQVSSFQHGEFHYIYDTHGWMTSWRDSGQTEVRYRYDDAGRVVETGTRQGYHNGRFVYEAGCTRVFDADGEWIYEHNAEGLVTCEVNPLGQRIQREWHLGRMTSQTDAQGRRTDFIHDALGKLVGVRTPTGATTTLKYDAHRRLTGIAEPGGGPVVLEYDRQHRLIARMESNGALKRYRYGDRGELLRVLDGEHETRLNYDAQLLPMEMRLPTGARFGLRFDVLGRLQEQTDPDGNITRYAHVAGERNPRGSISRIMLADNATYDIAYNGEGLPVEQVDPLGRVTRYVYGPFDLLMATVDGAGQTTRFEYDHKTRPTRVINAMGETWEYRYDPAGRLIAEVDWGGRITHYARDAVGRLLKKTLPDGSTWRYRYDAENRLIALNAGDVRLIYRYDNAGRLSVAAVRADTTHITRFRYDANGRLVEEDQAGQLLRHVYDARGLRRERKTPHRRTHYEYDALGALTSVGALHIQRDAHGRETGRQVGDFVLQRQYDPVGRILRQTAGPRSAFDAMKDDPVHALEQLVRQGYRYDASGQLTQVDTDGDCLAYQYDLRGQVTALTSVQQDAEHYTYDAAQNIAAHGSREPSDRHHYLSGGLPQRVGYASYRYDARGRAIEKTVERPGFRRKTWRYSWDGLNRLVKVLTPENRVWVYRYDAFNRRVEKTDLSAGESERFVWDRYALAERWTCERDGTTGQVVTWHITSESVPLAQETDAGMYSITTDQVGLPKAIFDETGQTVWRAAHTLWGGVLSTRCANDAAAGIDSTLRFPGQWADEESGLSYNVHRYYDPDAGQYLSPDPIGLEGGLRTQGYVETPNAWVDPLGLAKCPVREVNGTKIHGTGQKDGTPGHDQLSELIANKLAMSGKFTDVYLNRSYNFANGKGISVRRPDIMAVDVNGKVHSIELASKTDMGAKLPSLTTRNQAAMNNLPPAKQGEIIVLDHPYDAPTIKNALDQLISII